MLCPSSRVRLVPTSRSRAQLFMPCGRPPLDATVSLPIVSVVRPVAATRPESNDISSVDGVVDAAGDKTLPASTPTPRDGNAYASGLRAHGAAAPFVALSTHTYATASAASALTRAGCVALVPAERSASIRACNVRLDEDASFALSLPPGDTSARCTLSACGDLLVGVTKRPLRLLRRT